MRKVVATASPKTILNERRKLRQWQAAQLRANPYLDELILADPENERAYIEAFKEVIEEVIDEDPFFRAFDEALSENPDADPEAIATLLELAYPFDDPYEPDQPMPRSVFVAPAISIRRRSCFGRRASRTGNGTGKGGGDGGSDGSNGDGDSDGDSQIKGNARALDSGIAGMRRCITCYNISQFVI